MAILETPRLQLREVALGDAAFILRLLNHPVVKVICAGNAGDSSRLAGLHTAA